MPINRKVYHIWWGEVANVPYGVQNLELVNEDLKAPIIHILNRQRWKTVPLRLGTRMSNLATSIQHYSGGSSQSN